MPEFYLEPLTDRRTCFKCQKTGTGKKKLFKCENCHAITYCGVECQQADWDRHAWNCVPVMVTEFPGKGRGILAARDIKMGEVIFIDKPVIRLSFDVNGSFTMSNNKALQSLKDQIDNLPSEARLQFHKLEIPNSPAINEFVQAILPSASPSDQKVFKLFISNSKHMPLQKGSKESILYLNLSLVNHSCAPNAIEYLSRPNLGELRAVKDIAKGEEIVTCYILDVLKYGSISKKRTTGIKRDFDFDCKCPVCLGKVPGQEKTLKKLIEMHSKLKPVPSDWKREAGICNKIYELTTELYIGRLDLQKIKALDALLRTGHLARDQVLVRKALDKWRQHAEENNYEQAQENYEAHQRRLDEWSSEFKSNRAPEKRDIEFFKGISFYDDVK